MSESTKPRQDDPEHEPGPPDLKVRESQDLDYDLDETDALVVDPDTDEPVDVAPGEVEGA